MVAIGVTFSFKRFKHFFRMIMMMDPLNRQRKLFEAYLLDSFSECIEWKAFSMPENQQHQGEVEKTYDVDFLSFEATGAIVANSPHVSALLSASTSRIYSK